MPANPSHYGSFSFLDFSEERSSMTFHFGEITAASIPGFLTEFGAFRTATEAISMGTLVSDTWVGDHTKYSNVAPSDPNAQRERKWLVMYEDVTSLAMYRLEIPCADHDLAGVLLPGTDNVDLTQTEIAAWITAFEALCRSPEGNNVNVVAIRTVGRTT
jgi:hypothetical protein